MSSINNSDTKKYLLNKHKLDHIRNTCPKTHLYPKPIVGTEEIRQYVYCQRIVYFRHVMRAPMKQSYKMEYGTKKHKKLQQLKNKQEDYSQKYYNIYLTDAESGLVGLIDYFEYDGKEAYPVEIKSGRIPPKNSRNELDDPHKYQATAQAMLIEQNFDFLVRKVRIFYTKSEKYVDYPINIEEKLKVLKIIDNIAKIIETERIPEPTEDQGKCVDCECKLYCLRG
ncbi:MAG: CRISPR-associated protein Cas4 [Candidatus Lokiarchaeota archaeon]|nr:CRISPR-associated protein Cas4 [Candidatus Lokiarchaeota archaeon]MBD3343081.1 CRISPR-associated protein Cas4 [Candidatus Lokiarchaeota archaeon]